MCSKIIKCEILSQCRSFVLSDCRPLQTRRHMYTLYKLQASVNAYKFFSLVTVFVTYGCFA